MKCFDRSDHRREIEHYKTLIAMGIPTLRMIAYTDCSILLEEIESSAYRLGTDEDRNDPNIARLLAAWYKTLHEKGRQYANTHPLHDECDSLTRSNIHKIKEKTGTSDLPIWQIIEKNFDRIQTAAMRLPRTLTYNDFHYTNFAVARDDSSVVVFDYTMMGKGYVYSDIRNVCAHLGNENARTAFLSAYGGFDENEKIIDAVVSPLTALHIACQRENFPRWAIGFLDMAKDGRWLTAVTTFLGWRFF